MDSKGGGKSSLWLQQVRASQSRIQRERWSRDVFDRWLDAAEGYKATPPRNKEERM